MRSGRFRENFQPDAIALRAVDRTGNLSEPAIWCREGRN